jgi:hypothetical protein
MATNFNFTQTYSAPAGNATNFGTALTRTRSGISHGPIAGDALDATTPNQFVGLTEAGSAGDTYSVSSRDVDNIIDIEGFEKYGPPINTNIATFNTPIANLMAVHNNQTIMRVQSFFQEWNSEGGSTGSAIGIITGRAGGSSCALAISDGSFNTTATGKMLPANYSRTIVGFAFVNNNNAAAGIQFGETAGNGSQLAIWVDSLGRINLSRGAMTGGTVLYTSGALFLANAWHYIEIDFTIHNTIGAYTIWCDGVQLTTASGVNTRGIGTNNFWNSLTLLSRGSIAAWDDIYVRDNTNGTALPFGDSTIDALAVTANSSVQFSTPASVLGNRYRVMCVQTNAPGANQLVLIPVTPTVNMTINSVGILPSAGNLLSKAKGVIYSDNAGAPGSLLSSGTEVVGLLATTPVTLPLVTPQALTANTQYWIGYITDTSQALYQSDNFSFVGQRKANTYTSGAPAGPLSGMTTGQPTWCIWGTCTGGSNFDAVNKVPATMMLLEPIAYTSSSTVGQKDLFAATPMPITPDKVYSVKVSVLAQRSDVGARTMNIHANSNTVDSTGTNINITPGSNMQWYSSRFDVDPATNGAWGPTAINLLKIGYEVAS